MKTKRATKSIIGQKFGRLTVVAEAPPIRGRKAVKCVCDCGNVVNVRKDAVLSGHTQSCGCLLQERISGPNNWQYKGHPQGEAQAIRSAWSHSKTRQEVLERDEHKCQICGAAGYTHVHHILPIEEYPELARAKENMVTLCPSCHMGYHYWCKAVGEVPNDISFYIFYNEKKGENNA